jgi:single-strand DNA-binding protein
MNLRKESVNNMNRVDLTGRPVRDAEVRYSQGDKPMAIASLTLAVDRKFKKEGEPTADFINCKAFGKIAEVIEKYVRKGTKIAISGHIQTGNYTNKNGNKVYTTDVIIDEMEFCESKNANSGSTPQQNGQGFMNIPDGIDEELPFQ